MSDRITRKHLEALAERMNRVTGSPLAAYTRAADGHLRANVGNFHISTGYGGYCVHRMSNEAGGVTTPVTHGHVKAGLLYDLMHAWLRGYEEAKGLA